MVNPVFATDAELGHYGNDNTVEDQIALFTFGVNRTLITPTAALPKRFTTEERWSETYYQIGDLLKQADFLFEQLGYFAKDEKELPPKQYRALNDLIAMGLASLLEAREEHERMYAWGE